MKKKGNDYEATVGNLLFDIEVTDLEIIKNMLQRMWNKRNRKGKEWKKREAKEKPKEKERVWSLKKKKEKQDKK